MALVIQPPGHFRLFMINAGLSIDVEEQCVSAGNCFVRGMGVDITVFKQMLTGFQKVSRQFLSVHPLNPERKICDLFQSFQIARAFQITRGDHEAARRSVAARFDHRTTDHQYDAFGKKKYSIHFAVRSGGLK